MKITPYSYQPSFEAHCYKIRPFRPIKFNIQVDINPALGKNPSLVNKFIRKSETFEMKSVAADNPLKFSCNPFIGNIWPLNYYIKYEDTGNIDSNNGANYHIDAPNLVRKAAIAARKQHRQSSVMSLKNGTTTGKILFYEGNIWDEMENIKEPTILVCQNHDSYLNNPNIVGIIITMDGNDVASHHPLNLRAGLDVCALVLEPDIVNELKNLNEKNVEITCKGEHIAFQETDNAGKPVDANYVEIPRLNYCDRILTSKEYTSDIIGAKAVNLRKMEELYEQGKIDVIIPKSIALTHGFLKPIEACCLYTPDRKRFPTLREELIENGTLEQIMRTMKANGVVGEKIMVRSAFNGEDLPNYSAEGIYKSRIGQIENLEDLFDEIARVYNSKYGRDAEYSRLINHIPEDAIQPGILIQNRIDPDYKLRIYTDDDNDNVRINVFSGKLAVHSDSFHPHIFRYNKKTGKLTYDSIQMTDSFVTYDENENLIDITPIEEDLSENKKLFEQLRRVIKNALVIEKEFGAPQDIEGGIKGDEIYFWQTRNIVNSSC